MKSSRTEWRWGLAAASAIMVVALLPQVLLLVDRGADWHGANAVMHTDEVAYSAYTAALIRGRPRRNDPYTGREDSSERSAPESLFSIQFVPAYVVAAPARWFGLTAANVFMIWPVLCAAASSLATASTPAPATAIEIGAPPALASCCAAATVSHVARLSLPCRCSAMTRIAMILCGLCGSL